MIKKLVLVAVTIGLLTQLNTQAAISEDTVKATIVKHSMEMDIDPALALSIAKKESGYKHELKSNYGAIGVFQLLPSTAKKMGYNPYHLSENIKAGLTYYKMMYKMFGSTELALAAYNAGPGNVKKYGGKIPPYGETRHFVNTIMNDYHALRIQPDPIIAKFIKTPAIAPNIKTSVSQTPEDTDLPDLNEIPEVKQHNSVMEIL